MTYGNTVRNRVLEYLLETQGLDLAIGDMAKVIGISRPKAYEVMSEFEKCGYVLKSRVVGKTQFYIFNRSNPRVKIFMRSFKDCLRLLMEEQPSGKKLPARGGAISGSYLYAHSSKAVEKA
jgi:hypothetical protein